VNLSPLSDHGLGRKGFVPRSAISFPGVNATPLVRFSPEAVIVPAGLTVVSAVGASPPHGGVRRVGLPNVLMRGPAGAGRNGHDGMADASSRQGRLPPPSGDPVRLSG